MMKKILCFSFSLLLIFSLCACGVVDISSVDSVAVSSDVSVEETSSDNSSVAVSSEEPVSSKEESSKEPSSSVETSSMVQARGNIEITLENWEDYFEFAVIPKFVENAFGDVEKLQFAHLLKLKDEYAKLVDTAKTNMTIEVSFVYGDRNCEVDLENQTYTLGEYEWTEKETQIQETLWHCGVHGFDVYGFEIGKYFYISEVMNGRFCSYSDFELLRVQGSLNLK